MPYNDYKKCFVFCNGEMVYEGDLQSSARKMNISYKRAWDILTKGGRTREGYTIQKVGTLPEKEIYYQSIRTRLLRYGNTIICKDFKYVFERLDEDKIEVTGRKIKDGRKYHYIIERIWKKR